MEHDGLVFLLPGDLTANSLFFAGIPCSNGVRMVFLPADRSVSFLALKRRTFIGPRIPIRHAAIVIFLLLDSLIFMGFDVFLIWMSRSIFRTTMGGGALDLGPVPPHYLIPTLMGPPECITLSRRPQFSFRVYCRRGLLFAEFRGEKESQELRPVALAFGNPSDSTKGRIEILLWRAGVVCVMDPSGDYGVVSDVVVFDS